MKYTIAVILSILMLPICVFAQENYPEDIREFVELRSLCDHFRTEERYDEERKFFLDENTEKYCTGTDEALSRLKNKYKNNSIVLKKLDDYDPHIEIIK